LRFGFLCACDKKKFVHTFGLIRRRRRRPKKRATKREIDQMSNVKEKRKKGRQKPIKPKNKKKFETQQQS